MIKGVAISILKVFGYQLVKLKTTSPAEKMAIDRRVETIVQKISPEIRVLSGPFKGMQYPDLNITEASFLPKIVGSYECQLHDVIKDILSTNYADIIDVGSAEGYYAVGLAKSMPHTKVHAFDINTRDMEFCRRMAALNKVSNITYNQFCSPQTLIEFESKGRLLVFCDAEGYELELFTPEVIAQRKNTDYLIELHDLINPAITPTLISRFEKTHEIHYFNNRRCSLERFTADLSLSDDDKSFAVMEHRGGYYQNSFMEWIYVKSK